MTHAGDSMAIEPGKLIVLTAAKQTVKAAERRIISPEIES